MDAWMECATAGADVDRQRTEVQHLIVSMASLHKQQQSELKTAVLTKESEVRAFKELLQVGVRAAVTAATAGRAAE